MYPWCDSRSRIFVQTLRYIYLFSSYNCDLQGEVSDATDLWADGLPSAKGCCKPDKDFVIFFLYFAVFPSNIRKYSTKKVQIYLAKDLCEDGRASAKGCCKPNRKQCSAPNSVFVFWQPAFNCIALLCSCVLQRERESRIEMRRWILPKVAKLPDDRDHDYHYPKSTMRKILVTLPTAVRVALSNSRRELTGSIQKLPLSSGGPG